MPMYLLITPISSTIFRWGGVSSILISGSINTGYYEPLPLPSTIYGFLKYTLVINNIIKDNDPVPKFRGPLFYVESETEKVLCVHSYPQKLRCNNDINIKTDEGWYEHRLGIGLDRKKKITKEGYIYMEKMLNLQLIANKIISKAKRYGVLIDVSLDEHVKDKINGFVAPFGGESRPAKIQVIDFDDVGKLIRRNEVLLASPAIVDPRDDDNIVSWDDKKVNIEAIEGKITYRVVSLGFERGKRSQMKLGLMPTVKLNVEVNKNSIFQEGIGYLTDRGWGSVCII